MPPNFNDMTEPGQVNFVDGPKELERPAASAPSSGNAALKAVRSTTTLLAHIMIGIISGVSILFAFRGGTTNLNATSQHILLCVIGFQLLMGEAILSLAPDSWLSSLSLKHKRWVHWIMQIMGSVLALTGCFIKILDKSVHWNTLHGQFALVAMVFTSVSLVNGVTSMYAYEFRRIIPGILSKLTHICFGIVALVTASVTLAYGYDKSFFRTWATDRLTDSLIIIVAVATTIIIINPCTTFFNKSSSAIKN